MINKLSKKITYAICTQEYNTLDRARIQYALNILLCEGFKLVALFVVFSLIGRLDYFTLSLIILISIRSFAGGVHVKGNVHCLFLSTLLFICTCVIAPSLKSIGIVHYASATILSIIPLALNAPVSSVTRPIRSGKKRLYFKIAAISFSVLWTVVLFTFFSDTYSKCGFVTIILQNIQLIFVKEDLK